MNNSFTSTKHICVAILGIIILSGCVDRQPAKSLHSPVIVPPLMEVFKTAEERAELWSSNVRLDSLDAEFSTQSNGDQDRFYASFGFLSPEKHRLGFHVMCFSISECIGGEYEIGWGSEYEEAALLDLDSVLVSARDAVEIALDNGGSHFLSFEDPYMSISLGRLEKGGMQFWHVYFTDMQSRENLSIFIEAQSGEPTSETELLQGFK